MCFSRSSGTFLGSSRIPSLSLMDLLGSFSSIWGNTSGSLDLGGMAGSRIGDFGMGAGVLADMGDFGRSGDLARTGDFGWKGIGGVLVVCCDISWKIKYYTL